MTTVTETTIIGVELEFHFPDGVYQKELETIKDKIHRHCSKSNYSSNAMFFFEHNFIRVVIGYEVDDFNPRSTYNELSKPLTRLINSHKEAATYRWSN